jgi:hypothetical protein
MVKERTGKLEDGREETIRMKHREIKRKFKEK